MRIVGGKFKGKKINLPIDKNTRPLRDIVKEAIFNLIEHSNKFNIFVSDSNILDLFSGSGSFGIECISRGAKNATFIENYPNALTVLKNNIISIQSIKNSKIIESDCFNYFKIKNNFIDKFHIIFLDPPYKEKKINFLIKKIKEEKILHDDGIIIIHRHKKDEIEITNKLNILETRYYGISKIIIGN